MPYLKFSGLLSLCLITVFFNTVFAQDKRDDTLVHLKTVIVSGNRFEELKERNSQYTVGSSKEEIGFIAPQTSADLLGATGQVVIQKSQQGGGSPMIRGFSANRLLISVDGVRMNTAIFRSGNLQNIISIDPFSVENTEVLFGSGSVIYGSDAIGGVMNFTTLKPQFSPDSLVLRFGNATERYSSVNNEKTMHVDYNVGGKKWASVTSVSYSDFSDLKMGKNGRHSYGKTFIVTRKDGEDIISPNPSVFIQDPTGYRQLNLLQKIGYKRSDNLNVTYGFLYSQTSNYSRYDRLLQRLDSLPKYAQFDYGPELWVRNNISISYKPKKKIFYSKLNVYLAHQYFEESRISRRFNSLDKQTRSEKVHAYSFNMDFLKSFSSKHVLSYGIESVLNTIGSTGFTQEINIQQIRGTASRYPKSNWLSNAIYITEDLDLNEKIKVKVGARYNHFILNAVFDTANYPFPFTEVQTQHYSLTGHMGVVYSYSKKVIFKVNISNAFRSPNVDDMGKVFDSEPGNVVVPNVGLSPEYAYTIDFGNTLAIGKRIKFEGVVYYTLLRDALVRRDFQFNGLDSIEYDGKRSKVQAIQNAASAYVYGFNGGLEVDLPYNFKFISQLTLQVGEEELDEGSYSPMRHAAPLFGLTHLRYEKKDFLFAFSLAYSAKKDFVNMPLSELEKEYLYAKDLDGNPFSPEWITMNVKARYSFSKFLKVTIGVDNISDLQYRQYSSGLVAGGRNYIISVSSHF